MDFPGNDYPNDFNYPVPSFPQPLPAPDVDPDEGELTLVAYNFEWQQVLSAAVDQLMQYSSWAGDHNAKILAVNRANTLKFLLQNPVNVPETDYPTPYWDDETDVDDEAPIEEQEWYGEVTNPTAPPAELTFQQNAIIWLFTGFVLIAAAPSGPGAPAAALFFRTIAKRFVLAVNRGDVREIFRIVIDLDDYLTVDTGDMAVGDIMEIPVNGLEDAAYHDIKIIRTLP